jgi:hypothetical protein
VREFQKAQSPFANQWDEEQGEQKIQYGSRQHETKIKIEAAGGQTEQPKQAQVFQGSSKERVEFGVAPT